MLLQPGKEGYEYGYAIFEPLSGTHVDSSKYIPKPSVGIPNINVMNDSYVQNENIECTETHLSLSTEELIDMKNDNTFCVPALKLKERERKVFLESYFINDENSCINL